MFKKIIAVGIGIGMLGAAAGYVPAQAESLDSEDHSAAVAEASVASFHASHPEPTAPADGSSQAEWNTYWQDMYVWWNEVPWGSVAAQWGCEAGGTTVELLEGLNGEITAQYSGMVQCDEELDPTALGYVGIPEPKSEQLAARAVASKGVAGILAVQQCDFPGGDNYCLTRPASGSPTLTASFQNGFNKTLTGSARLGSVPGTGSCVIGSQIVLGTLGTGGLFATWYATGTAAYSGRFSSAFMVGGSTYGMHCALM